MVITIVLLVLYLLFLLLIGVYAQRITKSTPEDYFLGGRTFGPVVIFFTMVATNFSAFFFLGFAGKAYSSGFGQYGIMGFGTAVMAIMFYIIGRKVWLLGRERGYITPPELIGDIFQSKFLKLLFMAVMIIFTIPYLATQAIGAGRIIESMLGGGYLWGAGLTMVIVMGYVLLGGMRGAGWTDVIQGVLMVVAMTLAVTFVAQRLGGFETASLSAYHAEPALFDRPGPASYFSPQMWLSFMLLWVFCDPMFPQLFSRFYTAKSQRALKLAMILYPILVSFLFLCPVLIGVWAKGTDLVVSSPDQVLPLMVRNYAPTWVFALIMLGALAALMSTADSQLLSLSTMLSHDLLPKNYKFELSVGKAFVVLLSLFAIFFVVFGYDPKIGIMDMLVKTTFSGLVVLCPTTIAALYWDKATKYGCSASIIIGELSVGLFQAGLLPTFGFLDGILALAIATITLIVVSYLTSSKRTGEVLSG